MVGCVMVQLLTLKVFANGSDKSEDRNSKSETNSKLEWHGPSLPQTPIFVAADVRRLIFCVADWRNKLEPPYVGRYSFWIPSFFLVAQSLSKKASATIYPTHSGDLHAHGYSW